MELFDIVKSLLSGASKALPASSGFGASPDEDPYKYAKIRNALPQDGSNNLQQIAAPLEHREFVEGFVKDNPIIGPPAAAVSTLGYYVNKATTPEVFRPEGQTPASIDQVFAGFDGIIRGMKSNLSRVRGPGAVKPQVVAAGGYNYNDVGTLT